MIQFLLTRIFPPEEYVYYPFSITFLTFFSIFANFGLGTTIIQHLSALKDKNSRVNEKLISEGFKLVFLFTTIISLLLFFTSNIFEQIYNMAGLGLILRFTSLYLFFSNFIYFFESTFQGLRDFKFYAFSNITLNSSKLLIVFLNLIVKMPIFFIIGLFSIVSLIQFIVIIIFIQLKYSFLSSVFRFNKELTKKLLKFSILIFFPILFLYLITKFNQFILAYYIDPAELANFIITLLIMDIISLPILIFGRLIFPYVSHYIQEKGVVRKNIDLIYNLIFKYGLLTMIPITFYIFYISEYLIVLLFGIKYFDASIYLKVYIFYLNIKMIDIAGGNFLWAANEPKIVFKLYAITALFTVILSMILIPYYYTYGAIISVVIPHSTYILYTIYLVKKKNNIKFELEVISSIFKYILSSIISISFIFIIKFIFNFDLNNLIVLICITGIYSGLYFALIILFKAISIVEIKDFIDNIKSAFF